MDLYQAVTPTQKQRQRHYEYKGIWAWLEDMGRHLHTKNGCIVAISIFLIKVKKEEEEMLSCFSLPCCARDSGV